eukprot:781583-Alexandrium_andersonii.AAC.1
MRCASRRPPQRGSSHERLMQMTCVRPSSARQSSGLAPPLALVFVKKGRADRSGPAPSLRSACS